MARQCSSVRSMPIWAARALARSSSHSAYSVRKPSGSTWTVWPAMVVTGIGLLLLWWSDVDRGVCSGRLGRHPLARHRHAVGQREAAAWEQDVPVDPAERELPE